MRRQVSIPNKLYHITKEEYVPSIMELGLIPLKNRVGRFEHEEDRVGIFLTSDWKAILDVDNSFSMGGLYLLEVDVSKFKDELIPDPAYDFGVDADFFSKEDIDKGLYDQFAWYVNKVIPPSSIKCLGVEVMKR